MGAGAPFSTNEGKVTGCEGASVCKEGQTVPPLTGDCPWEEKAFLGTLLCLIGSPYPCRLGCFKDLFSLPFCH